MHSLGYSTFGLVRKVYGHLTQKRRNQLVALCVLTITCSFLEAVSVGSIVPFLTALTSPESLSEINVLKPLLSQLNITNTLDLRILFACLFVGLLFISGILRLINFWFQVNLSMSIGIDFSVQVYRNTLYQSYGEIINQNPSLANAREAAAPRK